MILPQGRELRLALFAAWKTSVNERSNRGIGAASYSEFKNLSSDRDDFPRVMAWL